MMGVFYGFDGFVTVEIISADLESAFDAIMKNAISVFSVRKTDEITASFGIPRSQLAALRNLVTGRGESIRCIEKHGMYWHIKRITSRPVLIIGMAVLIFLTLFIPGRIMFIRIDGNMEIPASKIIAAAKDSGLTFFTSRKEVRSELLKNRIITMIPDIEWVGVNTKGCVAHISVRERRKEKSASENKPCSIVASRDGIISSISVSGGTRKCEVGQAVTEGQLLISGFTDCGNVLLSGRAEGEVYAYTSRVLSAIAPEIFEKKSPSSDSVVHYSIFIGKNRINLWKGSGICPVSCDRMYKEYWVTLPGGFVLPVGIVKEQYVPYETYPGTGEDLRENAITAMDHYLLSHMAGGRILDQNIETSFEEEGVSVKGKYVCLEMIGREKSDGIGEYYG